MESTGIDYSDKDRSAELLQILFSVCPSYRQRRENVPVGAKPDVISLQNLCEDFGLFLASEFEVGRVRELIPAFVAIDAFMKKYDEARLSCHVDRLFDAFLIEASKRNPDYQPLWTILPHALERKLNWAMGRVLPADNPYPSDGLY
jgi:hypothetical protein